MNVVMFSLVFVFSNINPLGVNWNKKYKLHPNISGYSYYYGDTNWGEVIYIGNEDVASMETEVQLHFSKGKITKAMLILGPRGMSEWNCMRKYKEINSLLSHKYGKYNFISIKKDPVIEDLISSSECYTVSLGLYSVVTYWTKDQYEIKSEILADEDGFYIEITYIHAPREKKRNKVQKNKIIKKL